MSNEIFGEGLFQIKTKAWPIVRHFGPDGRVDKVDQSGSYTADELNRTEGGRNWVSANASLDSFEEEEESHERRILIQQAKEEARQRGLDLARTGDGDEIDFDTENSTAYQSDGVFTRFLAKTNGLRTAREFSA